MSVRELELELEVDGRDSRWGEVLVGLVKRVFLTAFDGLHFSTFALCLTFYSCRCVLRNLRLCFEYWFPMMLLENLWDFFQSFVPTPAHISVV